MTNDEPPPHDVDAEIAARNAQAEAERVAELRLGRQTTSWLQRADSRAVAASYGIKVDVADTIIRRLLSGRQDDRVKLTRDYEAQP